MVNWTVTRRPFHAPVAFAISSPTFFGDCKFQLVRTAASLEEHSTITSQRQTHQTQWPNFGRECRGCTDLTSSRSQVDYFNFIRVLIIPHLSSSTLQSIERITHEFGSHSVVGEGTLLISFLGRSALHRTRLASHTCLGAIQQ